MISDEQPVEYCGDCKLACKGTWLDFGIGYYEYWGSKGVDVQWGYVSDCCEGKVFNDPECTFRASPSDPPD